VAVGSQCKTNSRIVFSNDVFVTKFEECTNKVERRDESIPNLIYRLNY